MQKDLPSECLHSCYNKPCCYVDLTCFTFSYGVFYWALCIFYHPQYTRAQCGLPAMHKTENFSWYSHLVLPAYFHSWLLVITVLAKGTKNTKWNNLFGQSAFNVFWHHILENLQSVDIYYWIGIIFYQMLKDFSGPFMVFGIKVRLSSIFILIFLAEDSRGQYVQCMVYHVPQTTRIQGTLHDIFH